MNKAFSTIRGLRFELLVVVTLFLLQFHFVEAGHDDEETMSAAEQRRIAKESKVWYARRLEISGVRLPFSPATLVIVFFSLYYLVTSWNSDSNGKAAEWCQASHILIMDHLDTTQGKLEDLAAKINNDPAVFAKQATKHSACPSKANGGNLVSPRSTSCE